MVSFECLTVAWAAETSTPAQKLVLVRLADRAHVDTSTCYPGVASIAKDCCLGERTVFRALIELEKAGHLKIQHGGGKHKTSVYMLPTKPANAAPFDGKPCHNGKHTLPTRQLNPATVAPQSSGIIRNQKGKAPRKFISELNAQIKAASEEIQQLRESGSDGDGTWHDSAKRERCTELCRKRKVWKQEMLSQ